MSHAQAGVDLGTAISEYEEAVRSLNRQRKQKRGQGSSGRGGGAPRGLAAAQLAAAGPQIRPKRRMPVGTVLLVGGATRMPAVRRFVRNMTGLEPAEFAVDPDLVGAQDGSAIVGGEAGRQTMCRDEWG